MQKITPFLWLDKNLAREAAEFYVSVFGEDSKILETSDMKDTPSGDVEVIAISLRGLEMTLMSAGPEFKFNESISFVINCDTQEEIDYFWEKLSAVPESEQCGWVKDKYGLSWQITPTIMAELMSGADTEKAARVTQAMLKMKKLDIETLKKA